MRTTVILFVIAAVIVVMRLMLGHQRDRDRLEGHEQAPEAYTVRGMLKLMKEERKAGKKAEKRIVRDLPENSTSVPIREFHRPVENDPPEQ